MCISNVEPIPNDDGTYPTPDGCSEESCEGRLWIYFSNSHYPVGWGTINDDKNLGPYTQNVICRQLGFIKAKNIPKRKLPPLSNDIQIWLTNLTCYSEDPDDYSKFHTNALQCNYNVTTSVQHSHENDVYLHCGEFI